MSRKDIRITSDKGKVDQDRVTISKSDEVVWFSHDNEGAIIVFASADGSPFHERQFQVPAAGSVSSGPARAYVAKKPYKYTVVGRTGVNDPVIIIDP